MLDAVVPESETEVDFSLDRIEESALPALDPAEGVVGHRLGDGVRHGCPDESHAPPRRRADDLAHKPNGRSRAIRASGDVAEVDYGVELRRLDAERVYLVT